MINEPESDEIQLKQLKTKDIKPLRDKILQEQNQRCALCNKIIEPDDPGTSLDHQHKRKKEIIGVDGAGLIRGVLCRSCNVLEGKIWNNTGRYIQPKSVEERIDFLESLILYYKKDTYLLIHPSEAPKVPKVSRRNYNKLKKVYTNNYTGKKKFPEYPKSCKLTLGLQILFEAYGIEPFN